MYLPAYEDGTQCSETSAYKIQTPGNYPEERIQIIPADFPRAVVTRRRLILYVHCLSCSVTRVFSVWPISTKCKGTYFLAMQYPSDRFLFAIMALFWVSVDIVP
jgi:hypothetical protein